MDFVYNYCSDIFKKYIGESWKNDLFGANNNNYNIIIADFIAKGTIPSVELNKTVYATLHIIYKLYNSIIKTSIYKIREKNFGLRSDDNFAVPYIADHVPSTASTFSDPFFTIYYTYMCYKIEGVNEENIIDLLSYYSDNEKKI